MTRADTPTQRLSINLNTLRQYLELVFYPQHFDDAALTLLPNGDYDDSHILSPVDRALKLHDEFVVFCGSAQADWYANYIQELIHFFALCGDSELIVQLTLREPPVLAHLRRFA